MKKISDKLYSSLNNRQRFVACWEAIARGDDIELNRLVESTPRFSYSAADNALRDSWNGILAVSLALEVDMRGFALTWQMAHQAGETEIAESSLRKLKTVDAWWNDTLRKMGLSAKAIKKARPDSHPLVEFLLGCAKELPPASNAKLNDYLETARQLIPVLED